MTRLALLTLTLSLSFAQVHDRPAYPTVYVCLNDARPVRFSHEKFMLVLPEVRAGGVRFNRRNIETRVVEYPGDASSEYLRIALKSEPVELPGRDIHLAPDRQAPFESSQVRIVRKRCPPRQVCDATELLAVPVSIDARAATWHAAAAGAVRRIPIELKSPLAMRPAPRRTRLTIEGEKFFINGRPTYAGRTWQGHRIEGLLFNTRMVQGIYDDLNVDTRGRWAYPDTKLWDPDRNTREFIDAMPEWRRHGVLGFTINLQGGSPEGYSKEQPWHNSAITESGTLRPDYMTRLARILDRADQLGMAVILGLFYFGQDQSVRDEATVVRAVDNTVDWVLDRGYQNMLIEVDNETDVPRYDHAILKPDRVHELIERVKARRRDGRRLLAGTSYGGGKVPRENVVRASDFLLLHGNGVSDPARIAEMVRETRRVAGYRAMPILFNEDDHFNFDQPRNNFVAAVGEYASWGYFDPEGYQCPPVNWGINTDRKRGFFAKVKEITGY